MSEQPADALAIRCTCTHALGAHRNGVCALMFCECREFVPAPPVPPADSPLHPRTPADDRWPRPPGG